MSDLWPRLRKSQAIVEYRKLGDNIEKLAAVARATHPQMTYAATGGRRAGESSVSALAAAIRSVAVDFGFPSAASDAERVAFDRAAAEQIYRAMDITGAEAGVREIWSFLAVVVMPDVTRWRFSGDNQERWIASDLTRHMFARLWWQARTFAEVTPHGSLDFTLLRGLSESDLNQLTERRSIGGLPPLARSIARVQAAEGRSGNAKRADLRGATAKIRRLLAFIDFAGLADEQIDDRVRAVLHEVRSSTTDSSPLR